MGQTSTRQGSSFLIRAAAFVVVMAGVRVAQPLIVPFLVSVFLAIICLPSLQWLQEKGVPAALALLVMIGLIGSVGIALVLVIGSSVNDFREQLPVYEKKVVELRADAVDWLEKKGIPVEGIAEKKITDGEDTKGAIPVGGDSREKTPMDGGHELGFFEPQQILGFVGSMLASFTSVVGNAFVILLTFTFLLLEAAGLPAKFREMAGGSDELIERVEAIQADIRRYVSLKTMFSLLTGAIITVWLWMLGVDYVLLWGLLAFLLNYVPNVGSFIAAVPPVGLALIQLGPESALYVALGFVVVNIVIGSVVEPRLMGRGLGLSTLVVFLSLIFWGWILGPMGMILSVPLTMIAKIILEGNPDTRWIAILMSSEGKNDE